MISIRRDVFLPDLAGKRNRLLRALLAFCHRWWHGRPTPRETPSEPDSTDAAPTLAGLAGMINNSDLWSWSRPIANLTYHIAASENRALEGIAFAACQPVGSVKRRACMLWLTVVSGHGYRWPRVMRQLIEVISPVGPWRDDELARHVACDCITNGWWKSLQAADRTRYALAQVHLAQTLIGDFSHHTLCLRILNHLNELLEDDTAIDRAALGMLCETLCGQWSSMEESDVVHQQWRLLHEAAFIAVACGFHSIAVIDYIVDPDLADKPEYRVYVARMLASHAGGLTSKLAVGDAMRTACTSWASVGAKHLGFPDQNTALEQMMSCARALEGIIPFLEAKDEVSLCVQLRDSLRAQRLVADCEALSAGWRCDLSVATGPSGRCYAEAKIWGGESSVRDLILDFCRRMTADASRGLLLIFTPRRLVALAERTATDLLKSSPHFKHRSASRVLGEEMHHLRRLADDLDCHVAVIVIPRD